MPVKLFDWDSESDLTELSDDEIEEETPKIKVPVLKVDTKQKGKPKQETQPSYGKKIDGNLFQSRFEEPLDKALSLEHILSTLASILYSCLTNHFAELYKNKKLDLDPEYQRGIYTSIS